MKKMKFLLEYKQFTKETTQKDVVEHWLKHYILNANLKWEKENVIFDKELTEDEKNTKWANTFWITQGKDAVESALKRISFNKSTADPSTDTYSFIDKSDYENILQIANNVFDKVKDKGYKLGSELFIYDLINIISKREFIDSLAKVID